MKMSAIVAMALPLVTVHATPVAAITSFSQSEDRTVTITYTLTEDAIVTLAAETNASGEWVAISDSVFHCMSGDVNREVSATGSGMFRKIEWHPDYADMGASIGSAEVRPILSAWPKDDPPDYMVVDLAETSDCRVRYYATTNALPGGLFGNEAYRTTKLVLRKIPAKGVTWMMGSSTDENKRNCGVGSGVEAEALHSVSFDSNYYMAVFETTQAQWIMIKNGNLATFTTGDDSLVFPENGVSYCDVREGSANTPDVSYEYPNSPHADSFLGKLRRRTGLSGFDLPSDAEWEYACRAGNGHSRWGNGEIYEYSTSYDSRIPGRYQYNQPNSTQSPAPVGSYAPNDWGIYDMHGNVFEWCLDWYKNDITALGGAINTVGGTSGAYKGVTAKHRNRRGGAYNLPPSWLRSACRTPEPGNSRGGQNGFRVKYGAAKVTSAQ